MVIMKKRTFLYPSKVYDDALNFGFVNSHEHPEYCHRHAETDYYLGNGVLYPKYEGDNCKGCGWKGQLRIVPANEFKGGEKINDY